jgi:pyroglutamyl-peptidase
VSPRDLRVTGQAPQRNIAALEEKGIPAAMSNHAGNHLCNQLFYLGLHHCTGKQPVVPVGFIHVPVLPEQVIQEYPDSPYLSLSISREAIATVLSELSLANGLLANAQG